MKKHIPEDQVECPKPDKESAREEKFPTPIPRSRNRLENETPRAAEKLDAKNTGKRPIEVELLP